jgi:hypothetical protein
MDEQTVQQPNEATNNGELNAAEVMDVDTSTNPSMLDEGFSTLSCKHQTNATSVVAATVAGQIIETSNPFDALQSLGSTHGWVHVAKKQGCIAIQMEQEEAKDE